MSARRVGATKYTPLTRYLVAVLSEQDSVRLTFAELEALVGPLSLSARATSFYWARNGPAGAHCARHGFTANLSRLDRAVTFTRRQP